MNLNEHQEKIDKEQEDAVYSIPFAKERYEICKQCDFFISSLRICKQCCCFMPVKVQIQGVTCPINKWGMV